jgi:hypothetical protein
MWLSASVTPAEAKFGKAWINVQPNGLIDGTSSNRLKPTLWLDKQRNTEIMPSKPPIIAHASENSGTTRAAAQLPATMPTRNPNNGVKYKKKAALISRLWGTSRNTRAPTDKSTEELWLTFLNSMELLSCQSGFEQPVLQ